MLAAGLFCISIHPCRHSFSVQRSEGDRLWPAWTRFACPGRSAHGAPWCGPPTPSETKKSFSGGKSSSYSYKFLQLEDSNHMLILQDSSSCSCFQVKQLWFSFPNTSERGRVRKNNILDMIYFWCGILWYTNMCIHTYIYIYIYITERLPSKAISTDILQSATQWMLRFK